MVDESPDTFAAFESALSAHLQAIGWLDEDNYLGDFWVVAALPALTDAEKGHTRYVHFGNEVAHHRALGLLHTSIQLLLEESSENN